MPTGYTSELYDGKPLTFPEFAAKCAHAFGAMIDFRDSPASTELPDEIEPSDYYERDIARTNERIADVASWSESEAQEAADAAYREAVAERIKSDRMRSERLERYQGMLAEARAWVPPTAEHTGLKDFMVEQIESSIKFDCSPSSLPHPPRTSGSEHRADELARLGKHLAYAEEQRRGELERNAGRQAWIDSLRASLAARASSDAGAGS